MIELSVHNITKFYGANKIFENISLEVKTGERIGFIGQNGCGKTTMMKIIMGMEDYQAGEIGIRKEARVGYLNQIPDFREDTTANDVIHMAFGEVYHTKKQMKRLEEQLNQLEGSALEKALNNYGRLMEQFEIMGGYEVETRISKVTNGLKISDAVQSMLFSALSGGEKTRVILAKILLEEPDILLLDEPTNHLDLDSIEWLEGFLKDYQGSVLIISHDRYFLDSVVGKIIELEFDKAEVYLGNYSFYVVEKERRFLIAYKAYQNQQKKIEQMERQIERYRIWGEMRDSEKMFKKAKELEKRLDKIDALDRPVLQNRKIRLNQNQITRSGNIVLEVQGLCKSFGNKKLLEDVNVTVNYQDSACIIGKNGCGKTTLLKMILGELQADRGSVRSGSQVKIGYLPQNVVYEDEEQTVLEYFTARHNLTTGEARSQLAKVLFLKEDVNKKIRFLSGGEKSRLRLCSLTFDHVNFMILDEPTNHLDIESREVLEETLRTFEGTLLFVSHDRYFINKVADRIISLDNYSARVYNGDYTYYLEEYRKEQARLAELSAKEEKSQVKKQEKKSAVQRASGPVHQAGRQRKIEQAEKEIEEIETKIKEMEQIMNLHSTDADKLQEIFEEKERLDKELERAYLSWDAVIKN
ncbi:MAG TPA: ABC transporter ATP-binding protein [Lachnospiraceae bacterium]|jgi:ATPase subunit of ABC transporter with duplicated ATPase domains|nr:ABC transporter ATP-binding protein [Lachnospiraceae bacterium]HCR41675.1 ABC transporter ATP-binding protein [Lachnospiraceae bacterium]